MICGGCGFDNPAGVKFCGECGSPVEARCPSCEASNPAGFKFCGECGTALRSDGAPERAPREYTPRHLADKILQTKSAIEGERKRVTVLFADVKSSMELASRTDPEEWHAILDRFFQILSDGVHRFEGTVNQYTGDGIMALFGAPIAHENHAQRACFASLHLRDELKKYADELRLSKGLDFSVRIGINSGDVVVGKIGDDLRMDYTAQGQTVGLAQRMEQVAAAHSICLSDETAKLVTGYFALRDLGEARIKGVEEALRVHELEGMGELRTRFDVSRARGLTRFVGRENDMQVLDQALESAAAGSGGVIGVVAEAGAGKSRLCFEFAERCRGKGMRVQQGSGVPHGKNIPLLPILQVFREYYGISEEDDDLSAREKIAGRMLLIDEGFRDSLPFVFDLMGVPDPDRPAPSMDPDARQKVLFGVMRRLVEARSSEEVTVTLIEDLHWVDPATETWLEQMVEVSASSRMLLLVNFRPEYHAAWMQKSYYRQLPLMPLGPEAIQELLVDMLGSDGSISGLGRAIHQRTAGNPFFTEEVVQALIEAGNLQGTRGAYKLVTPVDRLAVPNTVQSVLAARIDRLAEREKQVLQTASVIGKEFPELILELVAELASGDLGVSLQSLKDGEFIFQQSLYPVSEYAFKHPLTQEVALGSQLQDRRRRVHASVAEAIRETQSERIDDFAALVAHHYEEADDTLEAVRWHRRAAERMKGSDESSSVAHWDKVYNLAKTLPQTPEAMEHSLKACDQLLSNGWRTGLTEEAWEAMGAEGRALATRLDDPNGLYAMELGLATVRFLCGYVADAFEPIERAIELADEIGVLEDRVESRFIKCGMQWHGGRIAESFELNELVLELADGDLSMGLDRYGLSIVPWMGGMCGRLELWRGKPDEARASLERAIRQSRDLGHMEVVNWCLFGLVEISWITGTDDQTLSNAQRALELGEQVGSPLSENIGYVCMGMAHLVRGDPQAALEPLEVAYHNCTERRLLRSWLPFVLGARSDAHLALGDANAAIESAREGIAFSRRAKSYCFGLICELSLARALRTADARANESEILEGLARCDELLKLSDATGLAPAVAEERARLSAATGTADVSDSLRAVQQQYADVGSTGHAERVARELGS